LDAFSQRIRWFFLKTFSHMDVGLFDASLPLTFKRLKDMFTTATSTLPKKGTAGRNDQVFSLDT